MKLIVCISNNNGMMFNHRRQSKDKELIQKILSITKGRRLWISEYSASLFDLPMENVLVDNDCMGKTQAEDFCFIEDLPIDYSKADSIILFRWNRDYPADTFFEADLSAYIMTSGAEFKGNSHDLITIENYTR